MIDIEQYNFIQINNCIFISALAHELRFDNGLVLKPNQQLAQLLNSIPEEQVIQKIDDISFVKTTFKPNPENEVQLVHILDEFFETYPKTTSLFVGSIVAVQTAWRDINVVSPITTPETTRLPPNQKICYFNKWNVA